VLIRSRQVCKRTGQLLLVIAGLIVLPSPADSSEHDTQWFPLRNHNPFLQVYGLPIFQDGVLAADGELRYSISLDMANHSDEGQTANESIIIDGETYSFALSLRYGTSRGLELGVDLPLIMHTGGIFDNAIEGWHDFLGLSNSKRSGPANRLNFNYENQALRSYELTSQSFGIGDVQLTAAVPLMKSNAQSDSAFTLRSSLKLPTGDEDTLRGSGAIDFSLGLYASEATTLANRDLRFSGFAGVLLPGKGDIFPALQRSVVAFGGLGAKWQLTDKFGIAAQTYIQGPYLDSALDEMGGASVQLAFGGIYRIPQQRLSLAFALVENMFADAAPDVGLHVSVRWSGGKQEPLL